MIINDLNLSRRRKSIKFSRVIGLVRWVPNPDDGDIDGPRNVGFIV